MKKDRIAVIMLVAIAGIVVGLLVSSLSIQKDDVEPIKIIQPAEVENVDTQYYIEDNGVSESELENIDIGHYIEYGMTLGNKLDVLEIVPSSSISDSGILIGDMISNINGNKVASIEDIKHTKFSKEPEITIEVLRNEMVYTYKVNKETCKRSIVTYRNDGLSGYIKVGSLLADSYEQFKTCIEQCKAKDNKIIVIDLRNNLGGSLKNMRSICGIFIGHSDICYVGSNKMNPNSSKNLADKKEIIYGSSEKIEYALDKPIVILMNENTASEAELMAIGLKLKCKDVTLVGTKTRGDFKCKSYMKQGNNSTYRECNTGEYVMFDGKRLDGIGVTPDLKEMTKYEQDIAVENIVNAYNK